MATACANLLRVMGRGFPSSSAAIVKTESAAQTATVMMAVTADLIGVEAATRA